MGKAARAPRVLTEPAVVPLPPRPGPTGTAQPTGCPPVPASSEWISEDGASSGEAWIVPAAEGLPGWTSSEVRASCLGVAGSLCVDLGPPSGLHTLLSASARMCCYQQGLALRTLSQVPPLVGQLDPTLPSLSTFCAPRRCTPRPLAFATHPLSPRLREPGRCLQPIPCSGPFAAPAAPPRSPRPLCPGIAESCTRTGVTSQALCAPSCSLPWMGQVAAAG